MLKRLVTKMMKDIGTQSKGKLEGGAAYPAQAT